jgi:hypothetical protein
VDVNELSAEAVRTFLEMPEGGEKEVEPCSDAVLTEYFGEYSPTAKSFLITDGRSEAFKEFVRFAAQWMLVQSNPTAVTKVRGSLIIVGWENRAPDWAVIPSAALIPEVTASRKYRQRPWHTGWGCFTPHPRARKDPEAGSVTKERRKRRPAAKGRNRLRP